MRKIAITAYKCQKCGRIHYPFHDRCLSCKNRGFTPITPQGDARLVSYTVIYNLPWGFDQRYLVIGIGEFENGVKAMGQIKADATDPLQTGMQLKASWEPVRVQQGENVYGLKFEPVR
jgi:uncharacterized OB-fold protein